MKKKRRKKVSNLKVYAFTGFILVSFGISGVITGIKVKEEQEQETQIDLENEEETEVEQVEQIETEEKETPNEEDKEVETEDKEETDSKKQEDKIEQKEKTEEQKKEVKETEIPQEEVKQEEKVPVTPSPVPTSTPVLEEKVESSVEEFHYFEDEKKNLLQTLTDGDYERLKELAKEYATTGRDFVQNGKEIHGVTFDELTEQGKKETIQNLEIIDGWIMELDPNYKEQISNGYQKVKETAGKAKNKVKDFLSTLGE